MEDEKNRLLEELRDLWRTYLQNKAMGFAVRGVVEDACNIIDELDELDATILGLQGKIIYKGEKSNGF